MSTDVFYELAASADRLWQASQLNEAFKIYLDLARKGDPSSQLNVAFCYGTGVGRRKNRRREQYWLRRAASSGYGCAFTSLARIAKKKGNYSRAKKYYEFAYGLGDGGAAIDLAENAIRYGSISDGSGICYFAIDNFILSDFEREALEDIRRRADSLGDQQKT